MNRVLHRLTKRLSVAGLLALAAGSASGQSVIQGPIVNPRNGHIYCCLSQSTWAQAEDVATQMGGHLVTINDDAENQFIYTTFSAPQHRWIYLGFNDEAQEGTFTWASGERTSYTHWRVGEPNNVQNEDIAMMAFSDGTWIDFGDGYTGGNGVVELDPLPCPDISVIGAPIVNPANGHTYYLLSPAPWPCAENYAQLLGGHLATINDEDESNFILTSFNVVNEDHRVSIGCNDAVVEGEFTWVSGQTSSYTKWYHGEPSNSGGAENYVAMYPEGWWNDLGADVSSYSVVEVESAPCTDLATLKTVFNPTNWQTYQLLSNSDWTCAEVAATQRGGRLVRIDDPDENSFLQSAFSNVLGVSHLWIGCTDVISNGSFEWTNGARIGFTSWAPNQPDNSQGENCVAMNLGTGLWSDTQNVISPPSMPRVNGVVETPTMCGDFIIEQGPIVNPANGHTYYRLSATSWSCAEIFAQFLDGHLVTINDEAENEFVRSRLANAPGVASVWLGMTDQMAEGTFVTTNGDPVTYTNWDAGEPNNGGGLPQNYVRMYSVNGKWDDAWGIDNPDAPVYGVVEVATQICPCDWNHDGVINSQDLFDFLTSFFEVNADFNGDGATNSQDFFDFIGCFFTRPGVCQ